jgi:DeoR/GlpR family transcriptional regulator of sugar metabolism
VSKLLIPAQRRERIHEYLALHKVAASTDLCMLLDVSEATVRRDLEWLESKGIVERTHGGAILSQRLQSEPKYNQRAQVHAEEKRLIGQAASSLVEPGDIIFVNSGTTTTQFIRYLSQKSDITIITNNLNAALEINENGCELIIIGGVFQPRSISVAGRFALENLNQIYANKAFIGVDGLSLKHGCTVPTEPEAGVVRMMIERTQGPLNILADHSKWGVVSNFEIAKIDQINRLITDEGFDSRARNFLIGQQMEILIVHGNNIKDQELLATP